MITLHVMIVKSYPSFPSTDGGLIAGADVDLFMVRVEGLLCCLESILVNNLAATSRSKHQLKHTIISTYNQLVKPSSLAFCNHPSTALAASGCKFLCMA